MRKEDAFLLVASVATAAFWLWTYHAQPAARDVTPVAAPSRAPAVKAPVTSTPPAAHAARHDSIYKCRSDRGVTYSDAPCPPHTVQEIIPPPR